MDKNVKKIFYEICTCSIIILIIMCCTHYSFGANGNLSQNNTEILQKEIKAKILNEETLSKENIGYSITKNGGIKINRYLGEADIIVIPNKIDGKLVEEIDNFAFIDYAGLEMIKVSKSISQSSNFKITGFEINKTLSNDRYIVYSTTKTYNPYYLKYIEFSEELKNKLYSKPSKFIRQNNMRIKANETLPESFDLRDKIEIKVEDQGEFGICYAYASLTSLETNIALKYGVVEDFSEIHLAVLSEQGGNGAWFDSLTTYMEKYQGPVNESEWSKKDIIKGYKNGDEIKTLIYKFCESGKIKKNNLVRIKKEMKGEPKYFLEGNKQYQYVQGFNDYNDFIKQIKQHIMNNGSLFACIVSPEWIHICDDYKGKCVMNTLEQYSPYSDIQDPSVQDQGYHAVSIVGWDDNFSRMNFPEEFRPKSDGAYLALNSWGKDWGENGYFWISYEDSMVNTGLNGITEVSNEKIDISNAEISFRENETYTGEEIKPDLRVYIDGKVLREYNSEEDYGDYEIKYNNNINAGTATITIKRSKKI